MPKPGSVCCSPKGLIMTISAEQFLLEFGQRTKDIGAHISPCSDTNPAELPQGIRILAKRYNWPIFPVSTSSIKATAASALIKIATSNISRLDEFPCLYPSCQFGLATGSEGSVWVAEMDVPVGVAAFQSLAGIENPSNGEDFELQTLLSKGGSRLYAFYAWPQGFVMKKTGLHPAPSLTIHGNGSWVPFPPAVFSGVSYEFIDEDVPVATTPKGLLGLLFETVGSESKVAGPPKFLPQPTDLGYLSSRYQFGKLGEKPSKLRNREQFHSHRGMFIVPRRR
jgi:hypothetical protein